LAAAPGTNQLWPGTDAVQLNVTVAAPTGAGFLTCYPDGTARPTASNLDFVPGPTVANQTTALVGKDGFVDVYNGSSKPVDLIVDTFGTYSGTSAGQPYFPLAPVRVLDTRTTGKQVPGNGSTIVEIAGRYGVPAKADAVVLNVTAADARSAGFLTAYPDGQPRPGVSNSDWQPGQVVPALVTVPLTNGSAVLHNSGRGAVDFIADLVGYQAAEGPSGAVFLPTTPTRVLDTRTGSGTPLGQLRPKQHIRLHIDGNYTAAALNLTVTGSKGTGFVTAYPDGTTLPAASSINYTPNQTTANMTITQIGTDGYINFYNGGTAPVSVIADLSGTYFSYH
jgi:hypothetical protein